jgi:hypothetical protein
MSYEKEASLAWSLSVHRPLLYQQTPEEAQNHLHQHFSAEEISLMKSASEANKQRNKPQA